MLVEQRSAHLLLERRDAGVAPAQRGVVGDIHERRRIERQRLARRAARTRKSIGECARRIVAARARMPAGDRQPRIREQLRARAPPSRRSSDCRRAPPAPESRAADCQRQAPSAALRDTRAPRASTSMPTREPRRARAHHYQAALAPSRVRLAVLPAMALRSLTHDANESTSRPARRSPRCAPTHSCMPASSCAASLRLRGVEREVGVLAPRSAG